MTPPAFRSAVTFAAVLVSCITASAQPPAVTVRTSLTRTAVWLGDRTTYTVELRCAPQVDVLLDDLAAGRVSVEGGDIVGVEEDHDDGAEGAIRRFRYTLVTYRVDVAELRIAAIPVRYYARRVGGVQGSPAGQVSVPPAVIGVRSVIPDSSGVPSVRLPEDLRPAPRYLALAQPVGLILVALAVVPLVLLSIDLSGHARRAWGRYRLHRGRSRPGVSLEDLRARSPQSDAERLEAFDRLDTLLREHFTHRDGIPAQALTPSEVRRELEHRAPALPHDDIEALLAACERARYAPDPPGADAWLTALGDAEQILARGRRR